MKQVPAETLHGVVAAALFVGLLFSVWSGYETVTGNTGACTANSFLSCEKIRQSGLTSAFGVPFWLIGIGGYVAMIAVDIPLYITWRRTLLLSLAALSAIGVAASLYFAYLELAVIHALCPVCTGAHAANVVVLASALLLLREGSEDEGDDTRNRGGAPPATP